MKMKRLVLAMLCMFTLGGAASAQSPESTTASTAPKGTILVVASSQTKMEMKDESQRDVGFYLNELAVPSEYLADHNYRIVLATPSGKKPLIDASSNDKKFFNNDDAARAKAVQFVGQLPVISLKEAVKHLDNYQALFVPGGHAPMTDLMQDPQLGTALRDFHAKNKPTAFICHGPVAALAALPDAAAYRKALVSDDFPAAQKAASGWIYKGYRMTVFSDSEEWPGEIHGGAMPFHVEQALQIAGAHMDEGNLFQSNVVRDREVVTGQNPASDMVLAKTLLTMLEK
ncbi:type 1 glutamine amidotransferase domain-containing protein [uncultured Megasphaera sp.]|uniref:type 1 glutamine amidotransferase domain-containing protein n=1 Tax=uncultured Megasphaera sp. TaxID=165188 RepID=UPI0025F81A29|nr:type 1 glutamine amidotransferase domain-containing protein [uncultured Megasphaera sp.]